MELSITVGDIVTSIIAIFTLYVAYRVAKSQIALNSKILLTENLVAVDALVCNSPPFPVDNHIIIHSQVHIQNISKSIIYLDEYTYNGIKYPNIKSILPPNPLRYYYIELPDIIDGNPAQSHIQIVLFLEDINNNKYSCSIFIDFINNTWVQKVERCTIFI